VESAFRDFVGWRGCPARAGSGPRRVERGGSSV